MENCTLILQTHHSFSLSNHSKLVNKKDQILSLSTPKPFKLFPKIIPLTAFIS